MTPLEPFGSKNCNRCGKAECTLYEGNFASVYGEYCNDCNPVYVKMVQKHDAEKKKFNKYLRKQQQEAKA